MCNVHSFARGVQRYTRAQMGTLGHGLNDTAIGELNMSRETAEKPRRDRSQADRCTVHAIESEETLNAVICAVILGALLVGMAMGIAIARAW